MSARCLPLTALVAALLAAAPATAHDFRRQAPANPVNDLLALGQGTGQTPTRAPVVTRPAPPMDATPRALCGPGSKPEPGIQGRVPEGSATEGLRCNITQLAHHGVSGGFKVQRYVDRQGNECGYYDTALLFPLNAVNLNSSGLGVVVLDMKDPAKPVQTDMLTEPPMLSPHESVLLNQRRGLIAAVSGNPSTYPGMVSIYDASEDCRHPKLQFSGVIARLGHESGFSEDGKTFYATGTAYESITAIDVTDPKAPHPIWQGNVVSHGMTLSEDGNRAYVAEATGQQLLILDTSEIQARKPNPQVRELSRLTWDKASIPQNAIPFTKDGHPYVLEFDEYNASTLSDGSPHDVGAARIIDVADERQPRIVSYLRLEVNQPKEHEEADGDPGADNPAQGYAAHYCNLPTRVDPDIVACSFIASGLRVFAIDDVLKPREVGYFVAPVKARPENQGRASNFAMSMPAFVPERREIWWTDGTSGFYALRVSDKAWPASRGGGPSPAARRTCNSRRRFGVKVRLPRGARVKAMRARLAGQRVQRLRRRGRYVRLTVDLRGMTRRVARLRVTVRLRGGRVVRTERVYHPCTPRRARPR